MFSLFNGVYDSYLAPTQLNLLVVGAPESGKTTLLERLKVTEIPSRPRKGSSSTKTVQQRIAADEPPLALKTALLETGATTGRSRHRSLSKTSLASASGTSSKNGQPPVSSVATPKGSSADRTVTNKANAVVVTKKKRFSLICPAPERYSRASQEQDEEYVDEEETPSSQQEKLFQEDSFSSDPPHRVRCHSKEMNVESLDLSTTSEMDNSMLATDDSNISNVARNGNNNRETSMESIGLDDDHHHPMSPAKAMLQSQQPLHKQGQLETGPTMLQSSPQEYNIKANAKMLPLRMIRPTSKFVG